MTDAVRAHLRLPFRLSAGATLTAFFDDLKQRRIVGTTCDGCRTVYVPPRAFCAACWQPCTTRTEVADRGAVESFVVVNVPFYSQQVEIPYVLGSVLLDGAGVPFLHLIGRAGADGKLRPVPAETGMRVRAVWRAERTGFLSEDIDHFEPEDR